MDLAAKPALLLFLDEPTSGLDANAAFSIVRFLKKLCAAGQAIICTIHQPSSILIQQFVMILALNPGGNSFYFEQVGANGDAVVKYFADRGVQYPPNKNVAEFILETAIKGGRRVDGKRIDWNKAWLQSKELEVMKEEIACIRSERSKVEVQVSSSRNEFAASTWTQTQLLTRRMLHNIGEIHPTFMASSSPPLLSGSLLALHSSDSVTQSSICKIDFHTLPNPTYPTNSGERRCTKFYQNRALWEARELPSRIYGWIAFCTASVVTEIPSAFICGTIYFLRFYFPPGLPTSASTAGYVYLMTTLFFLFMSSWGQWICVFVPSFTVISNVLPFFFVTFATLNGVVVPYFQLPTFWRHWMYYANPSQWWISGVISTVLADIPVSCSQKEAPYFNPPPDQTCAEYAATFVRTAGRGYITNPTESSNCGYCPYTSGTEFSATLNISPDDKWRDLGIFSVFVVTTIGRWCISLFISSGSECTVLESPVYLDFVR